MKVKRQCGRRTLETVSQIMFKNLLYRVCTSVACGMALGKEVNYLKPAEIHAKVLAKMTPKPTQHILELEAAAQKDLIDSFDLVFFDCDGVLWYIVGFVPNSGAPINLLQAAGKQCKFVSNNSLRTDAQYLERLKAIGVENVKKGDVVHTAKVMASYMKQCRPGERALSLCSREANEIFRENDIDFDTVPFREHWVPTEFVEQINACPKVSAVLFDYNLDLSFADLATASQQLKDPDCVLIAGGADASLPVTGTLTVAGFIDFIKHLSNNSGKEPTLLCKPSPTLGDMLKKMFDIKRPERCLFVGDSLKNDIAFAKQCGFQTLLVLSGTSTKEQMLQAEGHATPDYYADSVVDFVKLLANIETKK